MDSVEELKTQHFLGYKKAVIEIINNNTDALFDEDIMSLFKEPPLDSMDLLKTKIIAIAKKDNNVIDNKNVEKYLGCYREDLYKLLNQLKEKRKKMLVSIVDNYDTQKNNVFKLNKKDFVEFDKKARRELKDTATNSFSKYLLKNVNKLFTKEIGNDVLLELEKYFNDNYTKQIINSYDFKTLVKNTILINGVKEHSERYNFTLENSRLFNE